MTGNKTFNYVRIIALVFYSVIMLMGQMIGIPFIFYLIFTVFDFGNSDQIFAIFGLIGFFMQLVKPNKTPSKNELIFYLISFVLLLFPLVKRLFSIPIENYNYLAFVIPVSGFLLF